MSPADPYVLIHNDAQHSNKRQPYLLLDRWIVGDPEVADAMARSFLGKLPSELVDRLMAEGESTDYLAGTTIYREGAPPRAALVVKVWSVST